MNDRVFERRFSEHPAFWAACAAIVTVIYIYIFLTINEAQPEGTAGVIWLMLCFAMTGLSYLARRTKRLHHAQLRRWTDRAGSFGCCLCCTRFSPSSRLKRREDFWVAGCPHGRSWRPRLPYPSASSRWG